MTDRLIAFYGDDFTGSSASMEVLSFAGVPTILFLGLPTTDQLARFADYPAIGIAGIARAKGPAWMDANLPAVFETLASLNAPITHYKVCSTFDSSHEVGSIGRAIDLAVPVLGGQWHPLLVAAPAIKRYQLFGNLFAAVDGVGHRLDRHPTMARHPVTPMTEADVRLHLSAQTERSIGLIDYLALAANEEIPALRSALSDGAEIVAIDIVDDASLLAAGRLVWEQRGERLFAVGSQGIEYALTAWWRHCGLLCERKPATSVGQAKVAAVSGSCSPVTAAQIARAEEDGFELIALDADAVVDERDWAQALDAATSTAAATLEKGLCPLIFTARGPLDPAVQHFRDAVSSSVLEPETANARVGAGLGQIMRQLIETTDVRRLAIAGGDTSGAALSGLGIFALEAKIELAEACAISTAYSDDDALDGIEIALKGGQMGPVDYFSMIAAGRPANSTKPAGIASAQGEEAA